MKTCILYIALLVTIVAAGPTHPSFMGCRSSEDCGPEECCALGMMRFSVPTCKRLGNVGATCRPNAEELSGSSSKNLTLWYPDGTTEDVNVFLIDCPCMPGLHCAKEADVCSAELEGADHQLLLREDYTDADEINRL